MKKKIVTVMIFISLVFMVVVIINKTSDNDGQSSEIGKSDRTIDMNGIMFTYPDGYNSITEKGAVTIYPEKKVLRAN